MQILTEFKNLLSQLFSGDLSNQDAVVNDLITLFDVDDWSIVLDGAEALKLCDELAESIYEEPKEQFGPVMKKKKKGICAWSRFVLIAIKVLLKANHTIAWSNNDFLRLRCVDDLFVSFNTSLDYS
jgi:hypothetical protein